jgi:hypothetical protein
MKPFLPAIKYRPHVFREPDLWTLEENHLVRTSPNGTRLELPIANLKEIHIWRSVPVNEGVVKIASYAWAKVRFDSTWYRLYGCYPRGIHGPENQSGAVSAMIYALVSARRDSHDLTIRIGARAERVSAQVSTALVFLLPAACFLSLPFILRGDPTVSFVQVLVLSVVAMIASWALCWWKLSGMIARLNEAGKRIDLTPVQYLDEPPF